MIAINANRPSSLGALQMKLAAGIETMPEREIEMRDGDVHISWRDVCVFLSSCTSFVSGCRDFAEPCDLDV